MIKFQIPNSIIFQDINYYPVTDRQTDGRTESDAYEPTVQNVQVGSKIKLKHKSFRFAQKITIKPILISLKAESRI